MISFVLTNGYVRDYRHARSPIPSPVKTFYEYHRTSKQHGVAINMYYTTHTKAEVYIREEREEEENFVSPYVTSKENTINGFSFTENCMRVGMKN